MKLGESKIPVYWHSPSRSTVIKTGKCGDNFGYIQDIKTLIENSTYGYDSLPKVGEITTKTEIIEYTHHYD